MQYHKCQMFPWSEAINYKITTDSQIPKTDKSDPRRLKKEMPRMLKSIGPEDRIVFVGITNAPWNCDVKVGMTKEDLL